MKEYDVNISDEAKQDLRDIYDYIATDSLSRKIPDAFIGGIRNYVMESLAYFPERFPVYRNKIRRAVYPKNTNYSIFFEVIEKPSEIRIVAIVNARQYTRYKDLS